MRNERTGNYIAAGVKQGALANAGAGIQQAGIGNKMSGQYQGRGNNVFNSMFPTLQKEMTNPQGFGADMGAINTANQQSIGGSVAGAMGQGNLTAARTGNAGSFAPALDEAARSGARQLSQNAVGTAEDNAIMKQQQRDAATKALGSLYGENTDATMKALGLADEGLYLSNNALSIAGNQKSFGNIFTDSFGEALGRTLGSPMQLKPQ